MEFPSLEKQERLFRKSIKGPLPENRTACVCLFIYSKNIYIHLLPNREDGLNSHTYLFSQGPNKLMAK